MQRTILIYILVCISNFVDIHSTDQRKQIKTESSLPDDSMYRNKYKNKNNKNKTFQRKTSISRFLENGVIEYLCAAHDRTQFVYRSQAVCELLKTGFSCDTRMDAFLPPSMVKLALAMHSLDLEYMPSFEIYSHLDSMHSDTEDEMSDPTEPYTFENMRALAAKEKAEAEKPPPAPSQAAPIDPMVQQFQYGNLKPKVRKEQHSNFRVTSNTQSSTGDQIAPGWILN